MILSNTKRRQIFLRKQVFTLVLLGGVAAGALVGCSAISIEEERAVKAAAPKPIPSQAEPQQKPLPPSTVKEAKLEDQPFKIQQLSVSEERGQTTVRVKFSEPVTQ